MPEKFNFNNPENNDKNNQDRRQSRFEPINEEALANDEQLPTFLKGARVQISKRGDGVFISGAHQADSSSLRKYGIPVQGALIVPCSVDSLEEELFKMRLLIDNAQFVGRKDEEDILQAQSIERMREIGFQVGTREQVRFFRGDQYSSVNGGTSRKPVLINMIPEPSWIPLRDVVYEVELVRPARKPSNALGAFFVKPVDKDRDEGVYNLRIEELEREQQAQKGKEALVIQEKAKLEEEKESSKSRIALIEDGLARFPEKALKFMGLESSFQNLKKIGLSSTGLERLVAFSDKILSIASDDIEQIPQRLARFKEMISDSYDQWQVSKEQYDNHHKQLEKEDPIRTVDYKDERIEFNLRSFNQKKMVNGRNTSSWSESNDGYRPAGSSTTFGWHEEWQKITDSSLIDAISIQFADDQLFQLIQKDEELVKATKEFENRYYEEASRSWDEVFSDAHTIIKNQAVVRRGNGSWLGYAQKSLGDLFGLN